MISAEQKFQIEHYLISKKLPLDILLEVKDHMILQIEDCMNEEQIDFNNAFSKVESSWQVYFLPTTYWMFYGHKKIPVIVKEITKEKYTQILKKAFILAMVSFSINLIFIKYADTISQYKTIFQIQNALFVAAPSIILILNYRILKHVRTDFKFRGMVFYTMYQKNIALLGLTTIAMMQIAMKEGKYAFWFLKNDNHTHIFFTILTFVLPLFLQTFIVFGIINFFEHKKTLQKLSKFYN